MDWMEIAAISVVILTAIVGVILTSLTLPGTWLMVLAAVLMEIWRPDMYSWYTIVILAVIALIAEAFEMLAGAAGAKRAGGGGKAATGAVIGGIAGAILGTMVFPIIGTIVGAVVGAGGGAALAERYSNAKTWNDAARIGTGAAVGRLAAVAVKGVLAALMAIILIVASFVP